MNSIFDPDIQNNSVDSKIVYALERISQVFRANLWDQNRIHGLSPIQIQIMIFLRFQATPYRTVTALAVEFGITKATISDAVRIVTEKGFVEKSPDPTDMRRQILGLTSEGKKLAGEICGYANGMQSLLEKLPVEEKRRFLETLLKLIQQMHEIGIISTQRMCFSCAHLHRQKRETTPYFCKLMQLPLKEQDLRLNCPEYQPGI